MTVSHLGRYCQVFSFEGHIVLQYLQLMCDEQHSFVLQGSSYDLLEQALAHVSIDGAQRVVQHVDIAVTVKGTGEAHTLLLTAAEVDTAFTDFRLVAGRKNFQVWEQAANLQNVLVTCFIFWLRGYK